MESERENRQLTTSCSCNPFAGQLSQPRADFELFVRNHGGEVSSSVTKKVTHLIR